MPVYMYASLDDPFALSGTQALGINATGQIVGSYLNAGGNHGTEPESPSQPSGQQACWTQPVLPGAPGSYKVPPIPQAQYSKK